MVWMYEVLWIILTSFLVILVLLILIIMIKMALNERDISRFFTVYFTTLWTVFNTQSHKATVQCRSGQCTTHQFSLMMGEGITQVMILTGLKSHLFLVCSLTFLDEGGEETSTLRKPDDKLQKLRKWHMKAFKLKSLLRLICALHDWLQADKTDQLHYVVHHQQRKL